MKKLLTALMLVVGVSSLASAKGIFINPGVRANNLGGAYTAVADDLTAIWWNPAGLTQIERSGAELSLFYAAPKSKGNVSLANAMAADAEDGDFPVPRFYGALEPDAFENKEMTTGALIPFVSYGREIYGFNVAAGFYASGGGGGEWSDEVAGANPLDTIKASIDKKYSYLVSNISLARALNEKFSLGAGLNYIYMNDATKISKAFASSPATAGLGYTGYSISLEHESSGGALEATAGFLYKPLEKLSIGGVFRSGTEITLKGTAKHARKGLTGAGLPDASVESKYEEKYNYPMTYGLGAAYQLTEKFLISAGFDANLYSNRKTNVSYTDPAAPFLLDNETSKGHWKDVYQYRIGAEYAVSDKLDLRGGFYTDPAIIDTDNITLINTDQYSLNAFSMGLGYKISDSLNLDANVSYAFSKKLSKDDRDYDYPVVSLRTGVGYSF